jgi:hypothetical protein
MPQQSQRRPRVTDLQPWQTGAPLDKSADLPLGWSCADLISRACERKLPKKSMKTGVDPTFQIQPFDFAMPTSMASPRLSTRRFGVRKPAQV